jgi:putative spermidine/putrescine transport system permease protein
MAEASQVQPIPSLTVDARPVPRGRPVWLTWNWLGVLPFFLFILAFLLLPATSVVRGALIDDSNQFTTEYMSKLLQPLYSAPYISTIEVSVITAVAGGLIGFLLAWAITLGGLPRPIRNAVLSFSGVASNFAGLPLAFALAATLGRTSAITKALSNIGIHLYPSFTIYSLWGICLAYTYFQIPFMVLIMTPALDGLRREWREAADNLGATQSQYWRLVALPILLPSLLSALALLFANAFGAYATAAILVGGGPGGMLIVSILVSTQFSTDVATNPHQGYALAFGMIIVVGITIILYTWLRQRAERWRPSGT